MSGFMNLKSTSVLALIAAAGTMPTIASAHIDMLTPLVGRNGDQKARPCEGTGRGPVYTFEPGATITLGVAEGIPHDSYFRIAFDDDGQDSFKDPASIDPINPNRDDDGLLTTLSGGTGTGGKCINNPADKCGMSDFCNVVSTTGASVLWDNLDPHMASSTTGEWRWTVTLPNVECNNCTLQIIQVMEDIGGHGPYDGNNDLYYRCVDIVLKRGTGNSMGTASGPAQNKGINCLAGQAADAGVPDASTGNDASVGSDAGSTGATAGGTAGGVTLGGGGSSGATGVAGGVAGGAAGGTGTVGGVGGTTGGGTGIVGGGASTGGTAGAGTAGGVASGTTSGTVPPGEDAPNDDGCDCAVSDGSPRYGNLISMGFLALALLWRRRHFQC
jgi:MYXO-CTERM domain-containing protein